MDTRILVVEDDPAILDIIQTGLSVAGYEVLTAEDGQAALELIEAEPVDLALLDIMLPFVDGFELIEPLKARGTPVIYLSAKGDTKSKVHGLKLGAEDYLVKPFDMLELLVRVEKVLARQQPRAQELLLEDIRVDLEGR